VLTDDPMLTCRIQGYRPMPVVRVVADSHLRTPLIAQLVATANDAPVWILHRDGAETERAEALTEAGVRLFEVSHAEMGVDLAAALQALGDAGLTSVLVEGGAQLAAALLRDGLVDRIAWFHAPAVMGGDGWPAAQAFGISNLTAMPRFARVAERPVGVDMLTELRRAS
jgi:diaminohydroxyphosphoribosylaminopyrimidine deaminase/5-amino-6-(5-phosphoribosylamino)uracil reductase